LKLVLPPGLEPGYSTNRVEGLHYLTGA